MLNAPGISSFEPALKSERVVAKSVISKAAPCGTNSAQTRELPPPQLAAHFVPPPNLVQPSNRRPFRHTIGPVLVREPHGRFFCSSLTHLFGPLQFDGWVDPLAHQVIIGIARIPPPAYPGAPPAPVAVSVSVSPHPHHLIYPTPNPHGGQPVVHSSISANLSPAPNFPVRGQFSGAVRPNAMGQMCFTIHYQLYVRNAQGAEMPLSGLVEVVRLVCSSTFICVRQIKN